MGGTIAWRVEKVGGRYKVSTVWGPDRYAYPADYAPTSESDRRIYEQRKWEAGAPEETEYRPSGDRQDAGLQLFRSGVGEAALDRMLALADANPGRVIRLDLGGDPRVCDRVAVA